MRKLMVAALVVCAAIVSSATTVKWGTGALKTAADADGAFSQVALGNKGSVAFYVLTDAQVTQYSTDLAQLYKDATSGELGTAAKTGSTSSMSSSFTWSDAVDIGVKKNVALIVTYSDSSLDKDFYIATIGTATPASTTQIQVSNMASSVGAWTPVSVPEPTSGMLVLLGLAGMALRRRRA